MIKSSPSTPTQRDSEESDLCSDLAWMLNLPTTLLEHDADAAINRMLSEVGKALAVSRVYVLTAERDGQILRHTHGWTNTEAGGVSNTWTLFDLTVDLPGLRQFIAGGEPVCDHVRNRPSGSQTLLEAHGIKSFLLVSLCRGDEWLGVVGFIQSDREREWTENEKKVLAFLARLVNVALEVRLGQKARQRMGKIRELLAVEDGNPPTYRQLTSDSASALAVSAQSLASDEELPGAQMLANAERKVLLDLLERFDHNRARLARHLEISWPALNRRLKRLGIEARSRH